MQQQEQFEKRVIYHSLARAAFTPTVLGQLNKASQIRNAQGWITGLLLCHQGRNFGVLEGSSQAVDAAFERIARDPRHSGVKVLQNTAITERAFGVWKMGVADPALVPATLRRGLFAIADLMPPDAPLRGGTEDVRREVRRFLAGFASLSTAPLSRAS
jgi:hypothetical protein